MRRRFDASLTFDPRRGEALEHTGPGGRLEAPWQVELVGDRMTIDALKVFLRIGRLRVPVPRLLSVGVRAIQTTDPTRPDRIHIDLSLDNPVLGPIFGYQGTFEVQRRPRT